MRLSPGQRVAYYEVTGVSDPSPSPSVVVGSVLVDLPRGKTTQWDFFNFSTGTDSGWITGKRLGFAVCDENSKPVCEPALKVIMDAKRAAAEAEKGNE